MEIEESKSNSGILNLALVISRQPDPALNRQSRQSIVNKLEDRLQFYVSPPVLYELSLIPTHSRMIGFDFSVLLVSPFEEVGGSMAYWGKVFYDSYATRKSFTEVVRERLAEPDNLFVADPRLAELREQLLIEAMVRWSRMGSVLWQEAVDRYMNSEEHNPAKGLNEDWNDARNRTDGKTGRNFEMKAKEMSTSYDWSRITEAEANCLLQMFRHIRPGLEKHVESLSKYFAKAATFRIQRVKLDRRIFAASLSTVISGHNFAQQALLSAINEKTTRWKSPPQQMPERKEQGSNTVQTERESNTLQTVRSEDEKPAVGPPEDEQQAKRPSEDGGSGRRKAKQTPQIQASSNQGSSDRGLRGQESSGRILSGQGSEGNVPS